MCEAMKRLMYDEINDAQRKGVAQGVAQGKIEQAKETAITLAGMGMSAEKISEIVKVSLNMVQEWLSENMNLARSR